MTKSIDALKVDRAVNLFIRKTRLAIDDPIVIDLRHGLRMAVGHRRWKNEIEAARRAAQPSLFDQRGRMLEFSAKAEGPE